jgi:hypothetical protein
MRRTDGGCDALGLSLASVYRQRQPAETIRVTVGGEVIFVSRTFTEKKAQKRLLE